MLGQYYAGSNFEQLKLTRSDSTVNFDWGGGSPDSALATDLFSVRWSGSVIANSSETYTFYTKSDDGIRLWVNGQLLINNWTEHALTEDQGTITLVAGQKYDIRLEYYENFGGAIVQLLWSSPTQAKDIIPQSNFLLPDVTAPTASTDLASITQLGDRDYRFSVTYRDATAVKRSTIGDDNLVVTGPNNYAQTAKVVNLSQDATGGILVATYSIDAPGGLWDEADTGIYFLNLQANQVSDIDRNFIPAGALGTFRVDFAPPTAQVNGLAPIVAGGNDYRFAVTYRDNLAVKQSSLYEALLVTGPNNTTIPVQWLSFRRDRDAETITATYRILAPGGSWDMADSGNYAIVLQPQTLSDLDRNFTSPGTLANFSVDFLPPTVQLDPLAAVSAGSTSYQFTVTYRDATGVSRTTLGDRNIVVTGPQGDLQPAKLISVSSATDGSPLVATYRWDAPGGTWDEADSGQYWLNLQANQVSDVLGNRVGAIALGALQVDLTAPTATLKLLTSAIELGTQDYSFAVTYRDASGILLSSIENQDITVTGPNNFTQLANVVSIVPSPDNKVVTGIYRITAPAGLWNAAAVGTYNIRINPQQVSDRQNNFVAAATIGSFVFAAPPTPPPVDPTDFSQWVVDWSRQWLNQRSSELPTAGQSLNSWLTNVVMAQPLTAADRVAWSFWLTTIPLEPSALASDFVAAWLKATALPNPGLDGGSVNGLP
ncbi:PA14 domain-containing protein [Alkalinema sp. FACHB-956]|uniref:PA14 domain-containing protein n=1 Tax=Alkalinema sp. FACHB-956 TaxID=2692768 RepID=UPI00168886F3|nr:PA14 domain-containing protein [Alkalinema sp. FACHB-956]